MKAPNKRKGINEKRYYLFSNEQKKNEFICAGKDKEDAAYNAWLRFSDYSLIREVSEEEMRGSVLAILPRYE